MKTVLVVFGSVTSEHEVSLMSAASVLENIPKDKYNVMSIGITKDGRWLKYDGEYNLLPNGRWLEDKSKLTPAIISPDRSVHGITVFNGEKTENISVDVVFPVLHGKNGEDGTIQGFLQLAGLPFVGCDMISSAMCMDKFVTNTILDSVGIAQANWCGFTQYEYSKNPDKCINDSIEKLGFPIFVKPANAGSSVGVSKAVSADSLAKAILAAFEHDTKIVLEQGIDGAEVECAVLGNEEPVASVAGEVVASNEFYDYEAKYISGTSELYIPARISPEASEQIRKTACKAYTALGCSGLTRVDFFVQKSDGRVLLNELNTIPGFTSISMYPKMFEASGIPYPELLDKLLCLAMEKWDD